MTVLLAVVALVLAVVLFVVYRRLQAAEYWRRRHDERATEQSAALLEGQDVRASVEHALRTLWHRVEVVTPAEKAAMAVLGGAFPALLTPPGPRVQEASPSSGSARSFVLCPWCEDPACVAPRQCEDFFGADAP